jgi:hypothetical protein
LNLPWDEISFKGSNQEDGRRKCWNMAGQKTEH